MNYLVEAKTDHGVCSIADSQITFLAEKTIEQAFFALDITFSDWEDDCYIMMPSCAYNGNRFKRVVRKYPPMYHAEEAGVNCEPLITDLPALNPDGSGKIEVTTGDMATPCVGIFNRQKKEGFFLFTEQHIKGENLGFTVEKGHIQISFPSNRTKSYQYPDPYDTSKENGIAVEAGEKLFSQYKIFTFSCQDIPEFYKQFFQLRKAFLKNDRASFAYTKELWDLMEKHFNESIYSGEYYSGTSKDWQCGWTGGGMSTYPLLKYGTELSKERAVHTLDFLTNHQAKSGFFYGLVKNGVICDDGRSVPGMEDVHLIRKSADALFFLFKNFTAVKPKQAWIDSAKRCADAFVNLFDKYGKIGHFVNVETGELVIGNGSSGAIVSAGLAKAGEFFKEEKYLQTARDILDVHWKMFEETGMTNGGPGEALGAPDSESAFGLLESCVALYEIDKNPKWLSYAETVLHYCSSWVMSYSYEFPEHSEFYRLNINTVGSVFANVQNKHSSPGICTSSGDCILKLYRYTGNTDYLDLIKDIAYFIPHCVSTEKRPIYSYDIPPQKLSAGYICERVNTSDWRTKQRIGGVFCASCWPETSIILSFAELMTQKEMLP